ncbi:MAG: hypothetical protein SVO01_07675 [Thermotogota bacterium]|nr:hypothetical protein [Thermotogota bacterium]
MKSEWYEVEDRKTGTIYKVKTTMEDDAWHQIAIDKLHLDVYSEECFFFYKDGKKKKRFDINRIV